jgi:hypothetical protein
MKIRTKEQLTDYLDGEIAWRKKELTTLRSNVEKSSPKLEGTAIRSGLVLLYAHWEGFIKSSAEAYLDYVISKRLKYKNLAVNFMAISIKQKIKDFEQTDKATVHNQILNFIYNCDDQDALINKDNVIKTQSNLNSIILREMMTAIGLDFSPYETKSKLIDEQLLNYRNNIAHGQYLAVDNQEYLILHDEVRKMIDRFKTDIENAAILENFERKAV